MPDVDGLVLPPDVVLESALVADLRLLMHGPGARPGQELSKVGAVLRWMCGIAPTDSAEDALAAVADWLRAQLDRLDDDEVKVCVGAALGLDDSAESAESAKSSYPTARVRATAQRLQYGVNTVWRRVNLGFEALAGRVTRADSVLHQLGEHANGAIELGYVPEQGGEVRVARCFLIAALHPRDLPAGKVYALVREVDGPGAVSAIPAVRVRHVHAVSSGPAGPQPSQDGKAGGMG
jgi:hypothetical protein